MSTLDTSTVLDVLDDIFFVFDEGGACLEWNRATEVVTGYSGDELESMSPVDFFESDDADRIREAVAEVLETGQATVEVDLRTAGGEQIPYEFRARKLPDTDDGTARFAGIGRDVTERKEAERERREILDRMADGVFSVDTDWHITYANDRGAEVLSEAMGKERSPAELEEVHLWEEIPEAVDTEFYAEYHQAMATQETVTFEAHYPPMDAWFDVRAYPSESGLSVYLYDATERHQQREALKDRERVLREMYDIIADRQRSFTEQVEALLALGRAELGTKYGSLSKIEGDDYVFEVIDADDDSLQAGDVVPLSATNCERAASDERTLVLGDVARDAPDLTDRAGYTEWGISCYIGAPVYVDDDVYGTFCFYDTDPRDGQFSEWEVTLVDLMSRWVTAELQRQRANERLERQNEKLERFASIASHDLRNPLNVLAGWLELAEETGDPEQFEKCRQAIERMTRLIDDLLRLARAGAVIDETQQVDLETLVERSWQNVETGDARLRVETDRRIEADGERLQQLLENLVRNTVEHADGPATITVGDLDDGFYVADDGPGIPAEKHEAVFESGYTTASGTGFGLAIVREIADAHGWTVDLAESEKGGARFEFTGV